MNDRPERKIETLFQTQRGIVVRLTDGRALGPDGSKYSIFSSLEAYRRFSKDDSLWPEISSSSLEEVVLPAAAKILLFTRQSSTADAPALAASENASSAEAKARIFIAYSREDMTFADRLEAALKERGFEPLVDRSQIEAFEDWSKHIGALIARSDTVVFVLSPDAVTSGVVLKGMTYAASLNKRLAPIVHRRVEDRILPDGLRRLNFIFFDDPMKFEASADHLAAALQVDIGWIRQHTEYSEVARRWSANGRPRGLLLRSSALDEAERWIASRPHDAPEVAADTQAFVAASRRGANRTRRRGLALAGVLIAATTAGLAAWWNQDWLKERVRERAYRLASARPLSSTQEAALTPKDSFQECDDCPEMIVVPTGSFMMGALPGQGQDWERPQHRVTIVKPFAVAKYELTFDQWEACVAHGNCIRNVSDRGWGRGRRPVIGVSWKDAKAYVSWLSRITGQGYRLLAEAEFEYAARGGKETTYPWGDRIGKNNANCEGCGSKWDKQTAPVGSFTPNGFGIYDVAGNVSEWTEDCYHSNYNGAPANGSAWMEGNNCHIRVTRGGSYGMGSDFLRAAYRYGFDADYRYDNVGFRVARTLVAP